MTSALKHSNRTPEQEACWQWARETADELAASRGQPFPQVDFLRLYAREICRRLSDALKEINEAECCAAGMVIHPQILVRSDDGKTSYQVDSDPAWDREPFNKLRAPIIEAYTKGLT